MTVEGHAGEKCDVFRVLSTVFSDFAGSDPHPFGSWTAFSMTWPEGIGTC